MSSSVTIFGSSGNVGAALIKSLQAKYPAVKINAGVRDPAADKSKSLGVTLVKADLTDPASLDTHGADAVRGLLVAFLRLFLIPTAVAQVFVNTPGHIDRTQLAINGIDAAKKGGAKHVVVVSVTTADNAQVTFGRQFGPIEAHLKASGLSYTLLRLPFFIVRHP